MMCAGNRALAPPVTFLILYSTAELLLVIKLITKYPSSLNLKYINDLISFNFKGGFYLSERVDCVRCRNMPFNKKICSVCYLCQYCFSTSLLTTNTYVKKNRRHLMSVDTKFCNNNRCIMPAKQINSRDTILTQRPAAAAAGSLPANQRPGVPQRDPSLITAQIQTRDPSLTGFVPTSSKEPYFHHSELPEREHHEPKHRWWQSIYNKKEKTFCGRTCQGWILIIGYSILYLIFLSAYTMMFLFGSLKIIKDTHYFDDNTLADKQDLYVYPDRGIGLTATPTAEHSHPLIWYPNGMEDAYQKYISAIDGLLKKRRKREVVNATEQNLGPCGSYPYGYGERPCVLIRINKQKNWLPKPLDINSTKAKDAPSDVLKWLQKDKKLWLHCSGKHSYDKEHIGSIKYYPDPPGFDPKDFPFDITGKSPLIAVQISGFTLGISLAIQCQLWYDRGPSTIVFLLYVTQEKKVRLKERHPTIKKYRRK